VYFLRAQTYYEIRNYQSALNDVTIAVQMSPDYSEAQKLLEQTVKKLSGHNQEK
jgi:hypothetical protein